MKKLSNFNPFISGVLILSLAFIGSGCQKEDKEKAPQLPPESAFAMVFSDFEHQKDMLANETYVNRSVAVLHVAFWSTTVFLQMAIPAATFKGAFNHEPEFQENGSWLWSYSVNVSQTTFTARLYGKVTGNQVHWEMYISKTGIAAFTDFLWFTGVSNIGATEGSWTLYNSPGNPVPFVDIVWYNNSDGTKGITYTNIVPDGPENGGYITYEITGNNPYDASYTIFRKSMDNLVEINWNRETKAGQIRDPYHFSDNEFHCWNESGADIACP